MSYVWELDNGAISTASSWVAMFSNSLSSATLKSRFPKTSKTSTKNSAPKTVPNVQAPET